MRIQTALLCAAASLATGLVAAPAAAYAQSTDDIGVEILQLLVDEGLLPREKAQELMARAKNAAELRRQREAPATPGVIDVPYVPEVVRNQIRDEVRQEVVAQAKTEGWVAPNTIPAWLNQVTLSGDFRLRYQGEFFDDGNFPSFPDVNAINQAGGVTDASGFPLLNSTVNRHRVRYRARLGLDAKINSAVKVGLRLASGDDAGAISTNKTLGDYFNKDPIWIDRAYVEITPLEGLSFTGGRMPNPFWSTDMVWDPDINPEGAAISARHDFGEQVAGLKLFGVGGAFPLQERGKDHKDRWMYGAQVGFEIAPVEDLTVKGAVAYYAYDRVQSEKNAPDGSRLNDYTAPPSLSQGNSVFNIRTDGLTTLAGLASDFDLLNVTTSLTYNGFGANRIKLTADYVVNQSFDAPEIARLRGEEGVAPGDSGWQLRLDAGRDSIKKRGDWQLVAAYKRIETDAVLDIFTDSDFGLGGTDVKGYALEGNLGIYDNTFVGVSWLSTNAISRPPFAVDVLQLNLNARF